MSKQASREIERWCALQTAFWRVGAASSRDFSQAWSALNEAHASTFLIDLDEGGAALRPKPGFFTEQEMAEGLDVEVERARLYRDFLAEVARQHRIRTPLTLAIDVSDFPVDRFEAPVLSFQKQRGSPNILLPDVDFFYFRWYDGICDPVPEHAKQSRITFVGASTGGFVTADTVRDASLPRLALAQALTGHPRIDFRIGAAVQCTDEARALLEVQPYFSGQVSWDEQLRARFILSVDGNGATCSRVVRALMSNSILLKHASESMLYYFDGLVAGEHYLSVASVDDMERLLALDEAGAIDLTAMNAASQAFAAQYLTREAAMDYSAALLRILADMAHGPEVRRRWPRWR